MPEELVVAGEGTDFTAELGAAIGGFVPGDGGGIDYQAIALAEGREGEVHVVEEEVVGKRHGEAAAERIDGPGGAEDGIDGAEAVAKPSFETAIEADVLFTAAGTGADFKVAADGGDARVGKIGDEVAEAGRLEFLADVGKEENLAGGGSDAGVEGGAFAAHLAAKQADAGVGGGDLLTTVGGGVGDDDDFKEVRRVIESVQGLEFRGKVSFAIVDGQDDAHGRREGLLFDGLGGGGA